MSGQLKEIRTRISSVKSTQQITKAMKMVSAAKLRRATDAIIQMRPYSNKLTDILSNIASAGGDVEIEMAKEREIKNVLLIPVTSDRGLCGGFNANIMKLTNIAITKRYAEQAAAGNVTILPVGKKAFEYYGSREYKMEDAYWGIFQDLTFKKASEIMNDVMEGFEKGTWDRVEVIYSEFKNAATQIPTSVQVLPVPKIEVDENDEKASAIDFIFEPNREQILEDMVPKILRTQMYKFVLDSRAAEHGARMTAMDKATENANELLSDLRLYYNRARQAAITTELTEIVSGAEALNA